MAKLIFTIPTQHVSRVVNALKIKHSDYKNSGLTDAQMAKEVVRLWIIRQVKIAERINAINSINIIVPDEIVTGEVETK